MDSCTTLLITDPQSQRSAAAFGSPREYLSIVALAFVPVSVSFQSLEARFPQHAVTGDVAEFNVSLDLRLDPDGILLDQRLELRCTQ